MIIDNDGNGYVDDVHGWNFYSGNSQIDLYNDVTGCIWKDGAWIPFDDTSSGMLFFMCEEPVEADIAPISYPTISISGQEEKKAS